MNKYLLKLNLKNSFKYCVTIFAFIVFSSSALGQNIKISGVVKDDNNQTIPGISVMIQDTTIGTVTDIDGKYLILAPNNGTLVFSGVGLTTQIVLISGRNKIDIVLSEDMEEVDEAIVIGYGSIKKSHVTGSVSKVVNEQLDQIPVSRVDDALVGQISGVTVQQTNPEAGGEATIRVRGQGSISYDSNPLIVLDGIVVGNDADFLGSLDMNDIQSIEVLKDASSGAIYGSRGANGIIMITSKDGKEGPTKFSYNTYVGYKDVPKNDVLSSPSEWADYVRANNGDSLTDRLKYIEQLGTETDWEDVMYNGGMIHSHSISARGGTKNTKFKTSLSYLNDQGVLLSDNYEKINFRANLNTKLHKNVQFGVNINPSHINQTRFPIGVHDAIRQNPWLPLYLDENNIDYVNRLREDGRWADAEIGDYAMERMFDNYNLETQQPDSIGGTSISSTSNQGALAKVLERRKTKQQTKIYANTFFKIKIIEGLNFKQTFGGDYRFTKNLEWIGVQGTRNEELDSESTRRTQVRWHTVSESTLNYTKEIKGHSIDALAGFAYESWNTEETNLEATGFSNDLIQTIPAANSLAGGSMVQFKENLISYLGRVNYAYKDRYLLSASIRTDGSSKFGPDNKFGWFPAVSAGWAVDKESFFPENKILKELKIRLSYGITGNNSGIGEYEHLGLLTPVGTGFGTNGYNAINIENPNLKWERLKEFNPGLDASFFGRRLNLSFDYYIRNSVDLLLNVPIPSVTGFETALVNKGAVRNEGVEIELVSKNVRTRNFSWTTSVIATHNKNTLTDFAGADGLISIVDDKRPTEWIALEGNPISSFYGYVVEKEIALEHIANPFYPINAQSQDIYVKDLNGDGLIDPDDRTILGSPYPDFVWSLNNNFKYKDFDLSFMFQGSHGAEVRNISSQYIKNEFSSNQDYVTGFEDADLVTERIFTSDDIQDASYVALRNLNLGYSIPKKILSKIKLQKVRIYFSAQNLLYIMSEDYVGYNPEGIDQGRGNPLTYGYQRGPAPIYRTFSFGANIDF